MTTTEFSPAFTPSPRDKLDGALWPQDLRARHDFFDTPLEARPGSEILDRERSGALGALAVAKTEKTPEQIAAETATFGHLAAILASGGALGNVNSANYDGSVWRPTLTHVAPDFPSAHELDFDMPPVPGNDPFEQYALPEAA